MRLLDFRDLMLAPSVKRGRGNDEDGGVDEEGKHQRDGGIDGGELDRLRLAVGALLVFASLHNR